MCGEYEATASSKKKFYPLLSLFLQVGMFVCGGPVLHLEVNPEKPSELVCDDAQGKLYFLSWKE